MKVQKLVLMVCCFLLAGNVALASTAVVKMTNKTQVQVYVFNKPPYNRYCINKAAAKPIKLSTNCDNNYNYTILPNQSKQVTVNVRDNTSVVCLGKNIGQQLGIPVAKAVVFITLKNALGPPGLAGYFPKNRDYQKIMSGYFPPCQAIKKPH